MAHLISVAIQKGGVGKSTTVTTTAHALGKLDKKVLVVDLDPQHNASMTLGKVPPYDQPRNVMSLFTEKSTTFSTCAVPSKYKNVDLIASHIDFFAIGEQLGAGNPKQIVGLKNKLDQGALNNYDFIFFDCPPALGGPFLNNALVISDFFIIPLESESYYALKGVQQFLESVEAIQETINPTLTMLGVLITMYDKRTTVSEAMADGIRRYFGKEKVFNTIINRNTAINKATLEDKTIIDFDTRMSGAQDYMLFAKELIEWVDRLIKNN